MKNRTKIIALVAFNLRVIAMFYEFNLTVISILHYRYSFRKQFARIRYYHTDIKTIVTAIILIYRNMQNNNNMLLCHVLYYFLQIDPVSEIYFGKYIFTLFLISFCN